MQIDKNPGSRQIYRKIEILAVDGYMDPLIAKYFLSLKNQNNGKKRR